MSLLKELNSQNSWLLDSDGDGITTKWGAKKTWNGATYTVRFFLRTSTSSQSINSQHEPHYARSLCHGLELAKYFPVRPSHTVIKYIILAWWGFHHNFYHEVLRHVTFASFCYVLSIFSSIFFFVVLLDPLTPLQIFQCLLRETFSLEQSENHHVMFPLKHWIR